MIENCSYNALHDNSFVYPNLCIDLDAALRSGVILDTGTEVEYNGITDPSLVRGRVSDVFEAINERNSVVNKEIARVKSAPSNDGNDLPKD